MTAVASTVVDKYQVPALFAPYVGKINDLDAHEAIPVSHWREEFGSAVGDFVEAQMKLVFNPNADKDESEINAHNVWNLKMEQAPGAFDVQRRMKVIDFVGIDRQIIFPGGLGQQAIYLYNKADDPNAFKDIKTNRKQYAHKLIECHNDWCVRAWRGQTRLRTVAILLEDNVDDMYATLKTLIDKGVRLFQLSCTKPPGGVSPADPAMDRVWALASEAGIAFAAHVDGSSADGFLATQKWKHAPAFDGWKIGDEFALDPWTLTNLHLAVQNFITTLVLGGVFDRHKNLRFGVQEFGAHWVGPLAENMDRYYAHTPFPTDIGERRLKMKPSDYVRKHVRVAPFYFEPVGQYIDRYGFEDVYCFATDFPHYEGGRKPMEDFAASLAGQKDGTVRKFMVENAKYIMPNN
jgi:predicted TIM-barrel fold metal-dependent hydrolase